MMRDLFAEGAMSAAFVPTFTKTLTNEGKAAAWRLASIVINTLLLVTGVLVLLGIVFARPLVLGFAGDYEAIPGKVDLTVGLTRAMAPFLMLVAIAAVCMGMLNSLRRFFVPALSPATFNVATVLCALVLTPVEVAEVSAHVEAARLRLVAQDKLTFRLANQRWRHGQFAEAWALSRTFRGVVEARRAVDPANSAEALERLRSLRSEEHTSELQSH